MAKHRYDSGQTGGRYGLYLNKEPKWLRAEYTGMGSHLPASSRCGMEFVKGIHGAARARAGAKHFAVSRRRQAERRLIADLHNTWDQDENE